MRNKGLVFDELRRQRRALGSPMAEELILWVVVVVALYLVASLGFLRARWNGSPPELDHHPAGVAQAPADPARHGGRVAGSER